MDPNQFDQNRNAAKWHEELLRKLKTIRPMREVCANCKQDYRSEDKFCRYCGAPMGTPEYIEEDYALLYGPEPVERHHICEVCGYTWKTMMMADREKWCPVCGGPAPVAEQKEWT